MVISREIASRTRLSGNEWSRDRPKCITITSVNALAVRKVGNIPADGNHADPEFRRCGL
jgi:hypothetical protein